MSVMIKKAMTLIDGVLLVMIYESKGNRRGKQNIRNDMHRLLKYMFNLIMCL